MAPKMAIFVLASFLLVTSRVSSKAEESFKEVAFAGPPLTAPAPALGPHVVVDWRKECPGLCKSRCSLHSRPNLCNRACNSCCAECKCVPPGTAGHKEMCGNCYTDRLTHNNETKCP